MNTIKLSDWFLFRRNFFHLRAIVSYILWWWSCRVRHVPRASRSSFSRRVLLRHHEIHPGATSRRGRHDVSPPNPLTTTSHTPAAEPQQASQAGTRTLPVHRDTRQLQDRPHHLEAPTAAAKIHAGSAQRTRLPRCLIPYSARIDSHCTSGRALCPVPLHDVRAVNVRDGALWELRRGWCIAI